MTTADRLTARLDDIAGELERIDPRIALAVDQISDRLEERIAAPTFLDVRRRILDHLKKEGWKINEGLKVPYAVSPQRDVKLWFKTQSVQGVHGINVETDSYESAHSWVSDIREYADPQKFMELIEEWKKP